MILFLLIFIWKFIKNYEHGQISDFENVKLLKFSLYSRSSSTILVTILKNLCMDLAVSEVIKLKKFYSFAKIMLLKKWPLFSDFNFKRLKFRWCLRLNELLEIDNKIIFFYESIWRLGGL